MITYKNLIFRFTPLLEHHFDFYENIICKVIYFYSICYIIMGRNLTSICIMLIFIFSILSLSLDQTSAIEITSASIELSPNSIEHTSFLSIANTSIDISGSTSSNIKLLVLLGQNYDLWLNQTIFVSLLDVNVTNEFSHQFKISTKINTTIHVLLINTDTIATITYSISTIDSTQSSLLIFQEFNLIIVIFTISGLLSLNQYKRKRAIA